MTCEILVAQESEEALRQREYENLQLLELLALLEQSINWSEESATAPALRVMDAKLNVLIDLTQRLLGFHKTPMAQQDMVLTSHGLDCDLLIDSSNGVGSTYRCDIQIHPMVEQPLRMLVSHAASDGWQWQIDSDALRDAWEKWLFRQHRRWIAASKA